MIESCLRVEEDRTELQQWGRMDFLWRNAFCSPNPKRHLHTVIHCQRQGSLLTRPSISWLMDLSTIGSHRCRHHFNVCLINSSINTENILPSSYGGFVWAYVPIRPIMARSDRAYSVGETVCRVKGLLKQLLQCGNKVESDARTCFIFHTASGGR